MINWYFLGHLSKNDQYASHIVGAGAVPMIVACLDHFEPQVRQAALETLNNFNTGQPK